MAVEIIGEEIGIAMEGMENKPIDILTYWAKTYIRCIVPNCHSPTSTRKRSWCDLIMQWNPLPPHPTLHKLLRHFQATQEADFRYATLFWPN